MRSDIEYTHIAVERTLLLTKLVEPVAETGGRAVSAPPRRIWKSEDRRMSLFEAVALTWKILSAVMFVGSLPDRRHSVRMV
jgi:hypothetical protein